MCSVISFAIDFEYESDETNLIYSNVWYIIEVGSHETGFGGNITIVIYTKLLSICIDGLHARGDLATSRASSSECRRDCRNNEQAILSRLYDFDSFASRAVNYMTNL